MLSHAAANIPTTDIMFTPTDDPVRPFPALPNGADAGTPGAHEFLPYDFPLDRFPGWLLVARRPAGPVYDLDAHATDETNWAVIRGEADPVHTAHGHRWTDQDTTEAHTAGALLIDGLLLLAPLHVDDDQAGDDDTEAEHRARVASLVETARALADYPLLDESAYSQREHDAWCDYAADGLRHDTDLTAAGFDPDTADTIADAWDQLWPHAAAHLDHYNGFTGAHHPDFAHCIARALAEALHRPPF